MLKYPVPNIQFDGPFADRLRENIGNVITLRELVSWHTLKCIPDFTCVLTGVAKHAHEYSPINFILSVDNSPEEACLIQFMHDGTIHSAEVYASSVIFFD